MKKIIILCSLLISLAACNDYLNTEPISTITPENYFNTSGQLDTYVLDMYNKVVTLPYTYNSSDDGTDDKADDEAWPLYAPGQLKVAAEGGDWSFENIQRCNYFFQKVMSKYETGILSGADVDNAIGEMYFLRAYEYFKKLKTLGDFPIITEVQGMDYATLEENSKRAPRSAVARFILADLDLAINLVKEQSTDGKRCRIGKDAVRLFKSRVALFEASWLKNFAGTAFVPKGTNWPGATQNADFNFAAGSVDAEVAWLLDQCLEASKKVIENHPTLQENNGILRQVESDPLNPYFDMLGCQDPSLYDEILFWKDYNASLAISHAEGEGATNGNYHTGPTKGLVNSFLCKDGLPIYVSSLYQGDDQIEDVVIDRDDRLQLFLKVPGQVNKITNIGADPAPTIELNSPLFHSSWGYTTGYALRKFGSFDGNQCIVAKSDYGRPIFRTAEAYLNYMEASCMKNGGGSIDDLAATCWKKIRARAKVSEDYQLTISNTNMAVEAEGDWGAYTAGTLVTPLMYNIRRERRNEMMSEYVRRDDLRRWRSMDQMITTPYTIEGFKLWGSMQNWYTGTLITSGTKQNVSSPDFSDYLCPYHILSKHINYDGFKWTMAHYLTPIAAKHFTMSSVSSGSSTIYQNPYWGITTGSNPTSPF